MGQGNRQQAMPDLPSCGHEAKLRRTGNAVQGVSQDGLPKLQLPILLQVLESLDRHVHVRVQYRRTWIRGSEYWKEAESPEAYQKCGKATQANRETEDWAMSGSEYFCTDFRYYCVCTLVQAFCIKLQRRVANAFMECVQRNVATRVLHTVYLRSVLPRR